MDLMQKLRVKHRIVSIVIIIAIPIFVFWCGIYFQKNVSHPANLTLSPYPDGKNFAFTITDDPDYHALEKIKPVYDLLQRLGFKTTILVWTLKAIHSNGVPEKDGQFDFGETCQDTDYLHFVQDLQTKGFEVGLHTVSGGNDYREETIYGYEQFKKFFGTYPKMNIMHYHNLENIYWGKNQFSNVIMRRLVGMISKIPYSGEEEESPYFWGDILKEKTKYVRMWGSPKINTLRFNPSMPYENRRKPYGNYFFSFSNGGNPEAFKKLLSDKNIKKLVSERGTSIVYAHLGYYFTHVSENNAWEVTPEITTRLVKLSEQKEGWFVPASVILDRFLAMKNVVITETDNAFVISNANDFPIEGLTVLTQNDKVLYDNNHKRYDVTEDGEIILGTLPGKSVSVLYKNRDTVHVQNPEMGFWETARVVLGRAWMLLMDRLSGLKIE